MNPYSFRGPIFDLVDSVLREYLPYGQFRTGAIDRAEFAAFLDRYASVLTQNGIPSNDVHFAKRFPVSEDEFVRQSLIALSEADMLPHCCYSQDLVKGVAQTISEKFYHGGLGTYIYPEEGRLLLMISQAARPRSAIFLGSYYGYWAAWALPAILANGGRAVLIDPNPYVCSVAQHSLNSLYGPNKVRVVVATGEDYLANSDEFFDFIVLDAELPRTHPDPQRVGKGIYFHLLRAVLPHLLKPTFLICHNILFHDHSGSNFFNTVIARNEIELGPFEALAASEFSCFLELPTTEGIGVWVRR